MSGPLRPVHARRRSLWLAVSLLVPVGTVASSATPTAPERTVEVSAAGPGAGATARSDRVELDRVVTTATAAPTTTTTIAPPPTTTTTSPPVTAPPTTVAPPPPAPAPPPPPPTAPGDRARAAFDAAVPAAWRAVIPVDIRMIGGTTSWSWPNGRIEVSSYHLTHGAGVLAVTLAHEFGHLIAFRFGSQAFHGAAPSGWPAYSGRPEEAWADCVARALTGIDDPSHGLPSCSGAALSWTATWLAQGPGAHGPTS